MHEKHNIKSPLSGSGFSFPSRILRWMTAAHILRLVRVLEKMWFGLYLLVYVNVKVFCYSKERTRMQGVREQGAVENILI